MNDKIAVVFAASGEIASAVARRYAAEGARLYLSTHADRDLSVLREQLLEHGGSVDIDTVDATSPESVAAWLDRVVDDAGRIDTVFNGIGGRPETLGYPADALAQPLDDFLLPFRRVLASQFLTSREAMRRMRERGGGSVVTLSATLSGMTASYMASLAGTCGAIEAMTRAFAGEFGEHGIRVNCVRGSAMPETRTIRETAAGQAALRGGPPDFGMPPLGRPITVEDTAGAAVFLASDLSAGMTAQTVTVCAGQFPG